MFFNDPETIIRLTPEWTGPRLPDGRPMVSGDVLRRMRKITFEEAWGPLWNMGYRNNWECNFKMTHGSDILVGRAVTAVMMPFRPDLDKALKDIGQNQEGHKGFYNQWVIDARVSMGCDTAKDVLAHTPEEVAKRADLELETPKTEGETTGLATSVKDVFRILKAEFENDAE